MAIPIRLAVGPAGDSTIALQAQSIDIAIDRNVSAFPTPNNVLHRFSIDTNIPSVEIEINGIMQDDDAALDSLSTTRVGAQMLFNFASVFRTSTGIPTGTAYLSLEFQAKDTIDKSTSSITIDFYDDYYTGTYDDAVNEVIGLKMYNKYHQEIGTITGITISPNSTASSQQIQKVTLNQVLHTVVKDETLYVGTIDPLEDILDGTEIRLYPEYWRDSANDPTSGSPYIRLVFDATTDSNFKTGGGSSPTITQLAGPSRAFPPGLGPGIISVPIGGFSSDPANGNPASTFALIIEEALSLSGNITAYGAVDDSGSKAMNAIFSTIVSGPVMLVTQKFIPSTFRNIGPISPFAVPAPPSSSIPTPLRWEIIGTNARELSFQGKRKSAGDKVQDLVGIISNAKKTEDLIRGIQIPYDSLITSSAVTPIARNFFLTFGERSPASKGSSENFLSASTEMTPSVIPTDIGGESNTESNQSWLTRLTGNNNDFLNTTEALASFIGNVIGDTVVALSSSPHGNEGGIRIVPEKLHVRYDAGNNYYAFNLKLLASDFVIGV